MTFALFLKEWRESRNTFAWLFLLQILVFAGMVGMSNRDGATESVFVPLRHFILGMCPVAAFAVCGRLVTQEYVQRTHLFLETLPVTRTRVLAVKLLLGAGVMLAPVWLGVVLAIKMAGTTEPIGLGQVAILVGRATAFVLAVYGFFFATSLLGRYRVPASLSVFLVAWVASEYIQFDLLLVSPFSLIGVTFAYERFEMPWTSMIVSVGGAGAGLVLVVSLVMARDGRFVEALFSRMSRREKMNIALVFFGLAGSSELIDPSRAQPSFRPVDAEMSTVGRASVSVHGSEKLLRTEPRLLAHGIALNLDAFGDYLRLAGLPPISIVAGRDLPGGVIVRLPQSSDGQIVLRTHLASPDFDDSALLSRVVAEVLGDLSNGLNSLEPRAWLVRGLSSWWVDREPASTQERRHILSLRAAFAAPHGPDDRILDDWYSTEERLGPCLAAALSRQGVELLLDLVGPERFRVFVVDALSRARSGSLWALAQETALPKLFSRHFGFDRSTFISAWRKKAADEQRRLSVELSAMPKLVHSFKLSPLSRGTFEGHYSLTGIPAYTVVSARVSPLGGLVAEESLNRHAAHAAAGTLPYTIPLNARVYFGFDVPVPLLGCTVRIGSQRQVAR